MYLVRSSSDLLLIDLGNYALFHRTLKLYPATNVYFVATSFRNREFGMSQCECIEVCPFFRDRLGALPGLANMLRQQYCFLSNSRCARYRIVQTLGKEHVTFDLFPNDIARADSILAEADAAAKSKA